MTPAFSLRPGSHEVTHALALRAVRRCALLVAASLLVACASTGGPTAPPPPPPPAPGPQLASVPARPAPAAPPLAPVYPNGHMSELGAAQLASQSVAQLQPPVDLWDRIRRGFAMQELQTELVQQQTQWYASRPDYIQRMTDRSRKYLFHIVEELERRNMPTELALLPFIESAFNPQAVSSARAAGMWQFMPATGQYFDLKQNTFRDDRRDVLASTRAALDYLQKLYGMFGDWHLALAAYNWGEGSVQRAIARNQKSGLGSGYLDLRMPNETRNYVPKLLAVKNIVALPEQFRVELPLIENHPYFQSVSLTRDMDVALAAELADVALEDFRALNPQLSRPVILAAGTPQILLPWDNANVFRRNYEAHNQGKLASWTAWRAPATMSVAEAARRINMSESDLRSANTIPPRMLIKAGSVLIVPRRSEVQTDVTSHVADNGQLNLAPEVTLRRTVVKAGRTDSVASIARRYRLGATQVANWNRVSSTARFAVGQKVVLYLPARVAAKRTTARKPTAAKAASPRKKVARPVKRR